MGISYNIKKLDGELEQEIYTPDTPFSYELTELTAKSSSILGDESRYADTRLMLFKSGNIQMRIPQPWIIPVSDGPSKYGTITVSVQYKPERIAYKEYGDSTLWWFVLRANNLTDSEQLVAGMTIRIPNKVY